MTTKVYVPFPLVTASGATELYLETYWEPTTTEPKVSQDNCGVTLVGKNVPLRDGLCNKQATGSSA